MIVSDVGRRLEMIVPGQEAVVLKLRKPAPANDQFDSYAIVARRRPEHGSHPGLADRVLPSEEVTWHLYRPSMATAGVPDGKIPSPEDYLIAGGVKYVVDTVDAKSLKSFIILRTWEQT